MATSNNNIFLKGVSGKLGGQLIVKNYGDKTVLSKYPDMSKRKLSPKQKKNNDLMFDAHYAAKAIMADETLRMEAQIRLNVTRNKLYTSLIREYFQKSKEEGTSQK